ncbi:MAG: hypothetical protein K2H01_06515 [Ruminococcus sp.]|nr:hypothetical protein [Ruminococcus sp.]
MNINIKKFTAGLTAIMIAAASMGAATADAYGIIDAPNSALEYELSASIISDTQIAVTIEVTNNPGIKEIAFALRYSDNCTSDGKVRNVSDYVKVAVNNSYDRYIYCGCGTKPGTDGDSYAPLILRFYFDVENAEAQSYQFSSSVAAYHSITEGISFDKSINNYSYEETVGTSWDGVGTTYIIGDMNNNRVIEMSDATEIYKLADICKKNYCTGVNTVNNYFIYNYMEPINWRATFPNLVCANVADTDKNNFIEKADGDTVMNYYAEHGASLDVSNYYVGNEETIKTLTIVPSN